jgi:hypothetical protein
MDEEMATQARMQQIINEFSQLPQLDRFDLTLESLGGGNVKVSIVDQKRKADRAERVIAPHESLSFISETFDYAPTFTPNSKDIAASSVKMAYFNDFGRLIVEHEDSTEEFRVKAEHKQKVIEQLTKTLGSKLKV